MLVTNPAPDFCATAVLGDGSIVENFKLSENLGAKGTVLFSTHLILRSFAHRKSLRFHIESKSFKAAASMS